MMRSTSKGSILALLGTLLLATPSAGEEAARYWPQWRGPLANGVSPHGDPPLRWSEDRNVRFKVPVPGFGLSSPIVWDDRVFVMGSAAADPAAYDQAREVAAAKLERQEWPPSVDPVAQRFLVTALSRTTGEVLWQRVAAERVPHESHYIDSSWASASPITDGRRLFAHFGSNGLFAYDLDGELLWQKDLGDMTTRNGFGEGSSPALWGDTLVVNWDHEGESFIVALDAATGEERWRRARPGEVTSWATPLIVPVGGRFQAIVPATGKSRGYDLATGDELWRLSGMTVNSIPTPVAERGTVYLTSGYHGTMLQAVDLAKAQGDLEGAPAVRWTHERDTPYVPTPLLVGGRLYILKHLKGILTVLDAADGEVLYGPVRLPGVPNVWSSPVAADGRVYIVGRDGHTLVIREGDAFEVLADNPLDDRFDASPAVVDGEIYLRGREHLYAIATGGPGEGKTGPRARSPEVR